VERSPGRHGRRPLQRPTLPAAIAPPKTKRSTPSLKRSPPQ
jgi:hypothetical protein